MTKDEMIAFMNANPVMQLATVDGDKPRVRVSECVGTTWTMQTNFDPKEFVEITE